MATEREFDLHGFLLRSPQSVIAVDHSGRIVLANDAARRLVAPARLRVGADLPKAAGLTPLWELAQRLTTLDAPLPPQRLELEDGRVLRAIGTPAHGDEPAILLIEDVTLEWQEDMRNRDFIRNAAHQLRTPLAAISSAMDVLEAGAKDDRATLDRFLAHIRVHTERLTRIARGLLVLARIESGEAVRLDFVELAPLLDSLAEGAGAPVDVRCPDSLVALADNDLLHEAVAALLENAVKQSPDGGVVLTASEAEESVLVTVADTGPGVLPEHRARILEPFYRGTSSGDGFGLGLAIASRAVAAMNGDLVVTSNGSTGGGLFTIRLRAGKVVR